MNLKSLKGLLVELDQDELFGIDGGFLGQPVGNRPAPTLPPGPSLSWGGC